jgi:hypothetical protein
VVEWTTVQGGGDRNPILGWALRAITCVLVAAAGPSQWVTSASAGTPTNSSAPPGRATSIAQGTSSEGAAVAGPIASDSPR